MAQSRCSWTINERIPIKPSTPKVIDLKAPSCLIITLPDTVLHPALSLSLEVNVLKIRVNDQSHEISASPDTPLLWVLRDHLHLTGTKFGCGISLCGACTVHVDGEAVRSCTLPVAAVTGKAISTIEHLSKGKDYHPVQAAWLAEDVAQCGYCQSGQIMAAVALLNENPNPSDADIDTAMAGHVCRCGTYQKIRAAIHRAAHQV